MGSWWSSAALCGWLATLCGCAGAPPGRGEQGSAAGADLDPAQFACEVRIERAGGAARDTLRVIGTARNVSGRSLELCGRFDFGGAYKPCPECPPPERPPVLAEPSHPGNVTLWPLAPRPPIL